MMGGLECLWRSKELSTAAIVGMLKFVRMSGPVYSKLV